MLGDNVDTDVIIPAKHLNLVPTIKAEYRKLGSLALSGLPDSYKPFVRKGGSRSEYGIIIAGKNFGCGSSREHAPIALGAAGVKAVVAESYARIFFRNAVAGGEIYPLESASRLAGVFKTDDVVEIDVDKCIIRSRDAGKAGKIRPPGAIVPVIEAGGLFGYARSIGMIRTRR